MADSQMIQLFTNERKLLTELIWSFCTAPFVGGIQLRPKGRLSCIKRNEDMGRLDALQEMAQHEIKAIDRILWGYTARDCMEIIKQFLP